jgi:hypothetical protein
MIWIAQQTPGIPFNQEDGPGATSSNHGHRTVPASYSGTVSWLATLAFVVEMGVVQKGLVTAGGMEGGSGVAADARHRVGRHLDPWAERWPHRRRI